MKKETETVEHTGHSSGSNVNLNDSGEGEDNGCLTTKGTLI